MSGGQTFHERTELHEQLRNVRLHGARPRHVPIPRRLYRAGRVVWNAGIVAIACAVSYAVLVLVLSPT